MPQLAYKLACLELFSTTKTRCNKIVMASSGPPRLTALNPRTTAAWPKASFPE